MSNYHSIIRNYGEPQSNFNAELAIKALSYKQEKYDANAAKIQEVMNQYGNIDFAREEDRQNFYNKINNHIENIEGLRGADLSSTAITSSITNHISKALDQDTLKQITQTQQIRQFQKGLSELQKKDPSAITQTNYQYALIKAGYDKYISGESDDLGNLQYTPYKDPIEDILGRIKQVKDVMGSQSVDLVDGRGQKYTTTTDNMSVQEWMQYMPQAVITQQNREQFRIDGASSYGFNDDAAKQDFETKKQSLLQKVDEAEKYYQAILDDDVSDEMSKAEARKELALTERERANIQDSFSKIPQTAEGIGGYFMEQNIVRNLASMIGSDPSIKISKDQAYFDRLKEEKDAVSKNPFYEGRAAITQAGTDTPSFDAQKAHQEGKIEADQKWKQSVNSIYNQITDPALKAKIKSDQDVIKRSNPEFSDVEALHEAILRHTADNPETKVTLNSLKDQRDRFIQAEARALQRTSDDIINTHYKDIYKALALENHRKTIGGVPLKQYLRNKGITDEESMLSFLNSDDGIELKSAIAVDYALSEMQDTIGGGITNLGRALTTDGKIGKFNNSYIFNLRRVLELNGESHLDIDDILEFEDATFLTGRLFPFGQTEVREGDAGMWIRSGMKLSMDEVLRSSNDWQEVMFVRLKPGAENTKTGQAILNNIQNKEFSRPTPFNIQIGTDRTFYDDKKLRDIFSYSTNQEQYNDTLNAESIAIQGRNQVTINLPRTQAEAAKDSVFQESERLASHTTIHGGENFQLQPGQPVRITRDVQTGNITLSQFFGRQRAAYGSAPIIETAGKHHSVTISEQDFRRLAPTMANTVDLTQSENRLRFDATRTVESQPISFISPTNETAFRNTALFVGERGSGIQNMITADGTRHMIMHPRDGVYPNLSKPEFAQMRGVFDKALRNSNIFKAEMVAQGEMSHVSVKAGDTEIYKIPLSDFTTAEEAERLVYGTPQVFLGIALRNIALDLKAGESNRIVAQSFQKLNQALIDNGAK